MSQRNIDLWLLRLALPNLNAAPELPPLSEAEFSRLAERAERHGVLPAVVMNASRWTNHDVGALRESLIGPTGFAVALRLRLQPILGALHERDVQAVVLRGPSFADRLYPQPALRLFTDLDILVPRSSMEGAGAVLKSLGYELYHLKNLKHTAPYGEQLWKHPHHGQEQLEIHWNLVNSPALQRAVSVQFEDLQRDKSTGKLTPASMLLIAAVHGATSHSFDRLQILCDIRQIAHQGVDEDELMSVCRRTGAVFSVQMGLALAARAFRDDLCQQLRNRFGRCAWGWLLTPRVVLRSERPLNRLRRQIFRQLLKRR